MLIILDGKIINSQLIQFLKTSEPNTDGTVDIVNVDVNGNMLQILETKPNVADAKAFVNKLADRLKEANGLHIVDAR